MKRLLVFIVAFLIIFSVSLSGFSANAAVVKRYSTEADDPSDKETDNNQAPQNGAGENSLLPSRYSSADLGYTTSVKSQIGEICWAYSSVSTFESTLLKNINFYGDLSVDNIDNWGALRENGGGWQRSRGSGGYTAISVGYFTSWNGPVTDEDTSTRYGTTDLRLYKKSEQTEIKKAVMRTGAVTANYNDYILGKSNDRTAFYIDSSVRSISGHSISIVGWDDNYSKENFTGRFKPLNDGAWFCKNSWGNNNSIGGYLWISYEDYFFLNEDFFDYGFSIENYHEIKPEDYLYQNEEYGATYEFQYVENPKQTFFNVFDFSQEGNVLDKIIFETLSEGADYTAYYVPLTDDEKPSQDRCRWIKLGEGAISYSGYISVDFDDFTVPQRKAAIAVEIDASNTSSPCGVGVSEWLRSEQSSEYIFIDTCQSGKSFFEYNGQLTDVRDYYLNELDDDIGGTLVIKAVTNDTVITNIKGDVNLDGIININDVTLIQMYLANLKTHTYEDQLANADFNCDGKVNINDATEIQIKLAKGD